MSEVKIIGDAVKNMPWQEGPAEFSGAPVWRYSENPIIGRNPVKEVARIFNSAVMPYGDEFIGVFRGEQTNGIPYIYLGRSGGHRNGLGRIEPLGIDFNALFLEIALIHGNKKRCAAGEPEHGQGHLHRLLLPAGR